MMPWFLWFCVFTVGGATIYRLMSKDAGYLLVVWGNTSVEMSIWFALLTLLIISFVIWLCNSIVRGSWRTAVSAKNKVFNYNDEKAQRKTEEGLIEFIEGNWSSAHKKLTKSANKAAAPLINYLAAARSAYEMGNKQGALELLHKAESSNDRGRFAVVITQARMQFFNSEYEKCLATLERATALNPEHPEVLLLRQKVYLRLKDWASLKVLVPQLKKNK
ncbi:MAG: heme biosynthesis HemY N-terminal domain-containing protein, partial [Pseudomonadota bacterium]